MASEAFNAFIWGTFFLIVFVVAVVAVIAYVVGRGRK